MQAMSMRYVGEAKGLIIMSQAYYDGQQAYKRMMFRIRAAVNGTEDPGHLHEEG